MARPQPPIALPCGPPSGRFKSPPPGKYFTSSLRLLALYTPSWVMSNFAPRELNGGSFSIPPPSATDELIRPEVLAPRTTVGAWTPPLRLHTGPSNDNLHDIFCGYPVPLDPARRTTQWKCPTRRTPPRPLPLASPAPAPGSATGLAISFAFGRRPRPPMSVGLAPLWVRGKGGEGGSVVLRPACLPPPALIFLFLLPIFSPVPLSPLRPAMAPLTPLFSGLLRWDQALPRPAPSTLSLPLAPSLLLRIVLPPLCGGKDPTSLSSAGS